MDKLILLAIAVGLQLADTAHAEDNRETGQQCQFDSDCELRRCLCTCGAGPIIGRADLLYECPSGTCRKDPCDHFVPRCQAGVCTKVEVFDE